MAYCYILHSDKLNKFYIGVTNDEIEYRIDKHNNQAYGNHRFTAKANDWTLYLFFKTETYAHAVRIERKIKSMKSSKYIMNINKYPELKNKIFATTQST
jgi:putative endonuclease